MLAKGKIFPFRYSRSHPKGSLKAPQPQRPIELTEDTKMDEKTSELNDALTQFFGTAKDVVSRYTHCALCGASLHFSHVTDFSQNLTQEIAKCPECGVKVRQHLHRLQ